jgi:DNA-damage-inducible protein D
MADDENTMDDSNRHTSPFERIKHSDDDGEFWSARELAKVLEYASWQKFCNVVEKAEIACENSGFEVSDHFNRADKVTPKGKHGKYTISDYHLSRYACYLIVQNADPSKRVVALGQAYFAIQTRRQELAQELADKTEDQQRLILRDQVAEANGHLAEVASAAGVITQRDFALFQDHGYRGL